METCPDLKMLKNWFQGTKTYLFFASLIEERRQFMHDYYCVLVSLRYRPRNWSAYVHNIVNSSGTSVFKLDNYPEKMEVWIANSAWGLHFIIEDRKYGGVELFGSLVKWRREMLKAAIYLVKSGWMTER